MTPLDGWVPVPGPDISGPAEFDTEASDEAFSRLKPRLGQAGR